MDYQQTGRTKSRHFACEQCLLLGDEGTHLHLTICLGDRVQLRFIVQILEERDYLSRFFDVIAQLVRVFPVENNHFHCGVAYPGHRLLDKLREVVPGHIVLGKCLHSSGE